MEVHHHTHTERNKFTHYLWEFLMLFLAVFCGFLAENLREKNAEKHRGLQFIRSLAEDIKTDIHNLDSVIKRRQYRAVTIDSLFELLNNPHPDQYGKQIYYYARWLTYYYPFVNDDRTIQQLKYSGNFRLIHDQEVSDEIMNYDQQVRWIEPTNQREEVFIENYISFLPEIFDIQVFDNMLDKKYGFHWPDDNPPLLSSDKEKLQKLEGFVHFFKAINIFVMTWQEKQKNRAEAVLDFIRSHYSVQ